MADAYVPNKLSLFLNGLLAGKFKTISLAINGLSKKQIIHTNTIENHTDALARLTQFGNSFARGANALGSWEVRPGVVEMWGRYNLGAGNDPIQQINFPLILPNMSYVALVTPIIPENTTGINVAPAIINSTRQADSVSMHRFINSSGGNLVAFNWFVKAKVDFDYTIEENTNDVPVAQRDASGVELNLVEESRFLTTP